MISINNNRQDGEHEYKGLSTDTKYGYAVEKISSLFSVFPEDVEKYNGITGSLSYVKI